ncbi:MAG TPA: DMT family transporter [Candidatus Scatomorpha pullistercoris]|uniref:DMT family transporter n=1 Tax=Candidatus Scatomorpha pullistercoris TaxID=2840929 RepID=A0A9D1G6Z8_9FIRM|nr:DMT family transporter [Candidatus Scatomorpha pullistercoris]
MANGQNRRLGRASLLGATLIWGSSFIVLKSTLDSVPTLWVLALRFTGAAALMALIGWKELKQLDRQYLKKGAVLGTALFAAYTLQTFGLEYTTPGKNAFLTATYCVLVPFMWWAFTKKRPDAYNLGAALVCIIGMALVSLDGDLSLGLGDGLTICCGIFYALHIILTSRAVEGRSPVLLSMVQFAVAGLWCWVTAPMVSAFPTGVPASAWWSIAYLCFMCTGICFLLQTIGQKHTTPQTASIILTLESVFGTLLSVIFYHEQLSLKTLTGFVLIFIAVLISETKLSFIRTKARA